ARSAKRDAFVERCGRAAHDRGRRARCCRFAAPAGERRRAPPSRVGRHAAAAGENGLAQLRHRRADPARSERWKDAPARKATQDAEHGGIRSRSNRLRRNAAGARRFLTAALLDRSPRRLFSPCPYAAFHPIRAAAIVAWRSLSRASTANYSVRW